MFIHSLVAFAKLQEGSVTIKCIIARDCKTYKDKNNGYPYLISAKNVFWELCKTCGAIFYCFVHHHGRLMTLMKTKNRHHLKYPKCLVSSNEASPERITQQESTLT